MSCEVMRERGNRGRNMNGPGKTDLNRSTHTRTETQNNVTRTRNLTQSNNNAAQMISILEIT